VSESDIVYGCLELLSLKGIFSWRVNNVGIYDQKIGRYRSFHGMKGVSDIIGIVPCMTPEGSVGRLLAIEVKSPRGQTSPHQEAFLKSIDDNGGLAMVVRSVDDLEQFLKEEGY